MVPESLTVDVGQQTSLRAFPIDADSAFVASKHVEWSSDQPGVATVDPQGSVTGVALGSATISATADGIQGQAVVTVSPPEVGFGGVDTAHFTTAELDPAPAAQNIPVRTRRAVQLDGLAIGAITYGPDGSGWLLASLDTDTTPAILTLTPQSTSGLTAGTYHASLPVSSTTPGAIADTLEVELVVNPGPAIGLAPANTPLAASPGGADPTPAVVQVTNTGGGTLSGLSVGTISYGPGATGWIQSAVLNQATAPATLTITARTGSLVGGVYGATIPILSAGATNSPANATVTFTVTNQATIQLSRTTTPFIAAHRDTSPSPITVNVTNSSGGTLTGLGATVAYTAGTPGWLTASFNTTTAPATLTLTPASINLQVGTYSATVSVTSPVAVNSPRTIQVDVEVVSSFKNDIQPMLQTNCTNLCHNPTPFPLPAPWPRSQLVNTLACLNGSADSLWVKPGDPNASYLYTLTLGTTTCGFTIPMPPGGLSVVNNNLIANWILKGAPDN
jgi:hypothetical protein